MRHFNTDGPVRPDDHYCIPQLERVRLAEVLSLVEHGQYFALRAPRDSGKTSVLLALRELLNGGSVGSHRCAYLNVEKARTVDEDIERSTAVIAAEIAREARETLGDEETAAKADRLCGASSRYWELGSLLGDWARAGQAPLVLLIDDMDALIGDAMVALLRQLRAGFPNRPDWFPNSAVLCAVGDVRDYRMHTGTRRKEVNHGSVFNIKATSMRLADFAPAQVNALLGQHTTATGQTFAPEALEAVWEQTQGQPWLVNALAQEMCFADGALRRRDQPISRRDVFEARNALLRRREPHFDRLAAELCTSRVKRVVDPMVTGDYGHFSALDIEYARDIGLVAPDPPLRVANPIYGELLPRVPKTAE